MVSKQERQLPGFLGAMLVVEEAGMCRAWLNLDRRCGDTLTASGDPRVRDQYLGLRARMSTMLEAEAREGSGSRLRLDHPLVASMLANGKVAFFSEEEIEAAKRRAAHQKPGDAGLA